MSKNQERSNYQGTDTKINAGRKQDYALVNY